MKSNFIIIGLLVMVSLFVPFISFYQQTVDKFNEHIDYKNRLLSEVEKELSFIKKENKEEKDATQKFISTPISRSVVTSDFGYRKNPMGGSLYEGLHKGVDLVGKEGSKIKSVTSGIVVEHWPAPDGYYTGHPVFGGMVVIETDGVFYLYAHLNTTTVSEGDTVEAGQTIGTMGDSGIATGTHLHFEVVVNPLDFIKERFK